MGKAARPQRVAFGIILIVATALTISIQDVVFKLFSHNLTLWQIFALRGLLALPALFVIGWIRGQFKHVLHLSFQAWPLLRGISLTITFLAFYAAIPFLSLSTVGAANYMAPIFVALLSAHVIGEAVGRMGWISVLLGFAGVILLLQPGTDAFSPFALLPLMGAVFYAVGHLITRTRCQTIPAAALSLSLNTVMLLTGVMISSVLIAWQPPSEFVENYPYIFGTWAPVGLKDWLILALLAGFTVSIGMMLARAYQIAPPATIATFEYSYLVFVAAWDILFFSIFPSPTSLMGMVIIVIAGLLVIRGRASN